jgi:hypothetical protein
VKVTLHVEERGAIVTVTRTTLESAPADGDDVAMARRVLTDTVRRAWRALGYPDPSPVDANPVAVMPVNR